MTNAFPFPLFCTFFLVLINFTLTMMAGVYIVSDLGGERFISIYAASFYSIGNAMSIPLGKLLADHFGARRPILVCLLLFALSSFLCSEAPSFPIFVFGRLLQGIVSGPLYSLITRSLPKKNYVPLVNVTMFIAAPILGAVVGGWIAYDYNWRWLFYVNTPISIVLAAMILCTLKEPHPSELSTPPFDIIGYIFYCVGILCLGFSLTTGQEFDWFRSSLITTTLLIGIICIPFGVIYSYHHPHPFLNFRLFANKVFSFAFFNLAFLFSSYFGMIILLALWLSLDANYTPLWIGIILAGMAGVVYLPAILIHEKALVDCRIPLTAALLLLGWSCFKTQTFSVEINFGRIALARIIAGAGIALFVPAIFRMGFRTFTADLTEDVVQLFQVVRSLSSGLGAALYTILWQRRLVFYHDRLGSQLTVFSEQTQQFFVNAGQFHLFGNAAQLQLNNVLERQADSLALDDCFYLMGWIMVGLLVLCASTLLLPSAPFFPEKKFSTPALNEKYN